MQRIRKIFISALTAVLFVALLISAAFLSLPKNTEYAHAARGTNFTVIGSSTNDVFVGGTVPFKFDLLKQLYNALAGVDSYSELENIVKSDDDKALTSADFRNQQGGTNNVSIWFGGKKWDAVYLTENKAGDSVILTLWQSADNAPTGTYKFANRGNTLSAVTASTKYPSSMYSTSNVRVNTLNAGGYISTSDSALATNITVQSASNGYARFTMDTAANSVTKYIVKPVDVAYQETESVRLTGGMLHDCPNDAYGTPAGAINWENLFNFSGKGDASKPSTLYDSWKNDYLWLPSMAETGGYSSAIGLWQTDAALRSASSNYMLTRSGNSITQNAIDILDTSGAFNSVVLKANEPGRVRPAIHFNLTAADSDSGDFITVPSDITLDYDGEANSIEKAAQLGKAPWYDSEIYSSGIDVTYSSNDTTKAGEYDVTLTITDKKVWADASNSSDKTRTIKMTVNPVKIEIQSGKKAELEKGYEYVYHTDGSSKHALKFPDPTDGEPYNSSYVKLSNAATPGDKNSVKIYYHIETHDEKEHDDFKNNRLPTLKDEVKTYGDLPDGSDATSRGWVQYTEGNDSLNVNAVKGYCVFYKITADNHETLYGYFSVHIVTEILTIHTKATSNNKLAKEDIEFGADKAKYGDDDAEIEYYTQAGLKTLAKEIIDRVTNQNGENRLIESTDGFDDSKFIFYLKLQGDVSDAEIDTVSGDNPRWNAGTYELYIKYVDGDNSQFITFKWDGGKRPQLIIAKQKVELTWNGNANWESDKENASGDISDISDNFAWVYDGSEHAPTAEFTDKYSPSVKPAVTVTGGGTNARSGAYTATAGVLDNYEFTGGTGTRSFRIVKAKNAWADGEEDFPTRQGWAVGGEPSAEVKPLDKFGNEATVKYYSDPSRGSSYEIFDFRVIREPTTVYVRVTVGGNDNYDGLQKDYEFSIIACTDHSPKTDDDGDYYFSNGTEHWFECEKCGSKYNISAHTGEERGSDDTNHWKVCEICNEHYEVGEHNYIENTVNATEPTCTSAGLRIDTCECGKTKEVPLDPSPHVYIKDDDGNDKWFHTDESDDDHRHWHECQTCGQPFQEAACTEVEIPAKDPDCVMNGNTRGAKCSVCEKIITPTEVRKKLGHLYDEDDVDVDVAPTCVRDGHGTVHCTRCNQEVDVDIPATGHSYGDWKPKTAATCTTGGENERECTVCHDIDTQTVPAIEHKGFMEYCPKKSATVDEEGEVEHYHCTKCGRNFSDENGNLPISNIVIERLTASSGAGDWIKDNWLWIVIILAVLLVAAVIIGLIVGARRRRREREMMQMFMRGQGGYQPMSGLRYDDRPMIVLQASPGENGQLQLPSGITEETLANAIALAMQKVNTGNYNRNDNAAPSDGSNYSANGQGAGYGQGVNGGEPQGFAQNYGQPNAGQPQTAAYGNDFGGQNYAHEQPQGFAQNAPYGQPNSQGYAQPNAQNAPYGQPFVAPEPPQSAQHTQSAQPTQPDQPAQSSFTDDGGFYESYKKPKSKYDDDDDDDD